MIGIGVHFDFQHIRFLLCPCTIWVPKVTRLGRVLLEVGRIRKQSMSPGEMFKAPKQKSDAKMFFA